VKAVRLRRIVKRSSKRFRIVAFRTFFYKKLEAAILALEDQFFMTADA
jgi:Ulp1 family protease